MGLLAMLASSRVSVPWNPGSMNPAVEWIRSPSRPRLDLPSSRPTMVSGIVMVSWVDPSANMLGWSMNGVLGGVVVCWVSWGWGLRGFMCGVCGLRVRKWLLMVRSMDAGCMFWGL